MPKSRASPIGWPQLIVTSLAVLISTLTATTVGFWTFIQIAVKEPLRERTDNVSEQVLDLKRELASLEDELSRALALERAERREVDKILLGQIGNIEDKTVSRDAMIGFCIVNHNRLFTLEERSGIQPRTNVCVLGKK